MSPRNKNRSHRRRGSSDRGSHERESHEYEAYERDSHSPKVSNPDSKLRAISNAEHRSIGSNYTASNLDSADSPSPIQSNLGGDRISDLNVNTEDNNSTVKVHTMQNSDLQLNILNEAATGILTTSAGEGGTSAGEGEQNGATTGGEQSGEGERLSRLQTLRMKFKMRDKSKEWTVRE
jgi:hypothetical protein